MNEQELINNWNILIGLFRATVEQSTFLTGQTEREAKLIFKRWFNEGWRLCKIIEKESYDLDLDEVTDEIHRAINKLR